MLRIKTFSPVRWCCLNGVLDSSGVGGCEIRRGLFAPFPAVKAPSNSERSEDQVLSRATDFWFLCCGDEPVICLETSGRAYSTKGLMIELQPEYAKRRNIYDVVAEIHTRFLAGTAQAMLSVLPLFFRIRPCGTSPAPERDRYIQGLKRRIQIRSRSRAVRRLFVDKFAQRQVPDPVT
jgi:hypothetical protein